MPVKIEMDSSDFERFKTNFKAAQAKRPEYISASLSSAAELVVRRAKTHYLTGAALRVQTGRLRSSVTKKPSKGAYREGQNVYRVEVGTNVWYGRAWEEGFKVPARTIVPKNAKALRFTINGKVVFAKKVFQRARQEAARPWLKPSFDDSRPGIINLLEKSGIQLR